MFEPLDQGLGRAPVRVPKDESHLMPDLGVAMAHGLFCMIAKPDYRQTWSNGVNLTECQLAIREQPFGSLTADVF